MVNSFVQAQKEGSDGHCRDVKVLEILEVKLKFTPCIAVNYTHNSTAPCYLRKAVQLYHNYMNLRTLENGYPGSYTGMFVQSDNPYYSIQLSYNSIHL